MVYLLLLGSVKDWKVLRESESSIISEEDSKTLIRAQQQRHLKQQWKSDSTDNEFAIEFMRLW